jgi:hypothetical protein
MTSGFCRPAEHRGRRGRTKAFAAFAAFPCGRRRAGRSRPAPAMALGRAGHPRRLRARTGPANARPAGGQCQELAVAPLGGPHRRHPALGCTGRSAQGLPAGGQRQLPAPPASGLGPGPPRGATCAAIHRAHGAGFVRRGRAPADLASCRAGRPGRGPPDRRAAGRVLRLGVRPPCRPGAAAGRHAAPARGRRGRRHHRPHADRRHAGRSGPAAARTHGRGRPPGAGRRQHGPRARALDRAAAVGRARPAAQCRAAGATHPALPQRQGAPAGAGRTDRTSRSRCRAAAAG